MAPNVEFIHQDEISKQQSPDSLKFTVSQYEINYEHQFTVSQYEINYEHQAPYCWCLEFAKSHWPCKHVLAIFSHFPELGWDTLCKSYINQPCFNLDFDVLRQIAVDEPLPSIKKPNAFIAKKYISTWLEVILNFYDVCFAEMKMNACMILCLEMTTATVNSKDFWQIILIRTKGEWCRSMKLTFVRVIRISKVLRFNWTREVNDPFVSPFSGNPGLTFDIEQDATPCYYFSLFMKATDYEMMATETNWYYNQIRAMKEPFRFSRMRLWYDTCGPEIRFWAWPSWWDWWTVQHSNRPPCTDQAGLGWHSHQRTWRWTSPHNESWSGKKSCCWPKRGRLKSHTLKHR